MTFAGVILGVAIIFGSLIYGNLNLWTHDPDLIIRRHKHVVTGLQIGIGCIIGSIAVLLIGLAMKGQ